MMHRLLCALYFHQWGRWVDHWGEGPKYFPIYSERTCACCGARERARL